MNNSTIFAADRNTHVKIVAISVIASIAVLLVGMTARNTTVAEGTVGIHATGPAIKAGKPIAVSRIETTAIR
jgi:hypothetical protein